MNIIYKNTLFTLRLLFLILSIAAIQNINSQNQNIPSPAINSDILFSKFSQVAQSTADLYTGTININLPVYTYKDKDFEIPISIRYNSDGFKPNKTMGFLGLDWDLSVNGFISRKVNGLPDETIIGYNSMSGYLDFHNNSKNRNYYELFNDGGTDFHDSKLIYGWPLNGRKVESTPDEFTFNFLGHQGTFFLGPDTVYITNTTRPQGEYKIEVLSDDSETSVIYNFIMFKITTGDGYTYTFKDPSKLRDRDRVGYNNKVNFAVNFVDPAPIVNWPLVEITAPNNRKVKFNYSNKVRNVSAQPWATGAFEWGENLKLYIKDGIAHGYMTAVKVESPLQSIKIDDTFITFEYTYQWHEETMFGFGYLPTIPKLEFIKVYSLPEIYQSVKEYKFTYKEARYNELQGRRLLFLKSLSLSGQGSYHMDYYNEDDQFPQFGYGVDHWGYYNYGSITALPPFFQNDAINNEHLVHPEDYDPVPKASLMGMLEKITYPTLGVTKFYYEPHTYSSKVTKDLIRNNEQYLYDFDEGEHDEIAGGLRLKRTTTYSSENDSTYREFYYSRTIPEYPFKRSSGILLHNPRYYRKGRSGEHEVSMLGNFLHTKDKDHITYSEVIEKFSDGSYWHYKFSDYRLLPDIQYI